MKPADCNKLLTSSIGQDLTADDCAVLSKIATELSLENGNILFSAGESTRTLYVLLEGKIDVTKETTGDEYMTIHTLNKGDMAGEMGFIDGDAHSLTLRAHGNASLLCIEKDAFEALLLTHPHVVYHVMRAITRTTHHSLRRMNAQYVEMNRFINNQYTAY